MSTMPTPFEGRLILGSVSWETYRRILRIFDDRRLRITYDRGALEIMTLSSEHERLKKLLGYLILTLVVELGWNMASCGSMTFKRRRFKRGLEPDECYWIQNESKVRGKKKIDLRSDPPPDLVIEVEWTRSALNRIAIFAVLGVPEVWRYDGKAIHVHLLGSDGRYLENTQSQAFPFLPIGELARFLAMLSTRSETDIVREFRAWVLTRIAANWQ